MRICPKCNRRFPDNTLFCPDDGKALVRRVEEPSPQAPAAQVAEAQDQEQTWDQRGSNPSSAQRTPGRQPQPTPTRRESPPPTQSQPQHSQPQARRAPPSRSTFDPNDLVGQVLFGEYTITKKLGEGGMGAVYLAKQGSIDQLIAVKVLHEHSAESEELIQRFHREAKVVSMLTHPNIIRVFIFGRTQHGLLYLAMEYVEGQSLRGLLDKGPMDEITAIKIMKQLCSGLSEAHDLGVIHRDLKPDNVLLTEFRGESNFVKILDFGIAKIKQPDGQEEAQKLTQAGIVYGTPEYLSPEQAQALELDQRTDIYSLGVMLFEFMTGRVPFQGSAPVQILTAHVFNEPPRPSELAPDRVAPTMERIIMKAMAKDTKERYFSAMEMFEDLVLREAEILQEKGLDNRATYVPGMELTGMYKPVLHQMDTNDDDEDPTVAMAGPPTAAIEEARRRAGANPTMPATQATGPPVAAQGSNMTRNIIVGLIIFTGMLLVILVVTIFAFVL